MAIKTRLLSLKNWYKLEDAARRLSVELGEEVNLEDIVQFILEGGLRSAIHVDLGIARPMVPKENTSEVTIDVFGDIKPLSPRKGYTILWNEEVYLDGLYYLTIRGFAEMAWRKWLQGDEAPNDQYFEALPSSWYLTDIQDPSKSYYPVEIVAETDQHRPPRISEWVIFQPDLNACIRSLLATDEPIPQPEKPLSTRQKHSYLKLLEVLLKESKLDWPARPYTAAGQLQKLLDQHGISLSENTLASIVKEIQNGE